MEQQSYMGMGREGNIISHGIHRIIEFFITFKNMLGVFGSSSWHMIGKFDWGPHLPVMYARIMKGLCLPVHFKGLQNTPVEQCIKSFDASSASRWIVGTLVCNSD